MSTSTSDLMRARFLLHAVLALTCLAPAVSAAQRPLTSVPSGADRTAAVEAARQGKTLFDQSCASDGYDEAGCARAMQILERAATLDPSLVEPQLALAQAYWNQAYNRPKTDLQRAALKERALSVYRRLVNAQVQDARPYYQLSVRTKDPAERQPLLERTVTLDPRHADAHRELADVYLSKGRVDDAVRTYQAGLSARPHRDLQDGLTDVRWAQKLAAAGRPADAVAVHEEVLERAKDEPPSQRCPLVQSMDLKPYRRFERFTKKAEAVRKECDARP